MLNPQFNFYLLMFIKRKEKPGFFFQSQRVNGENFTPTDEVVETLSFCEVYFYHDLLYLSSSPLFSEFLQLGGGQLFLPLLAYAAMKASCKLSKSDLIFVDSSRVGSVSQRNRSQTHCFSFGSFGINSLV